MTAKEMFEELGYEQPKEEEIYNFNIEMEKCLIYIKRHETGELTRLWFWIDSKTHSSSYLRGTSGVQITEQLNKAIQQKRKELGWL